MRAFFPLALLLVAPFAAAQTPEVRTSDLGLSFDRVVFARPDSRDDGGTRVSAATPLVGVRVSGIRLEAAVLREAASRPSQRVGEVPADALLKRYRDATAEGRNLTPLFQYRGDAGTDPEGWRPVRSVERRGGDFLVILPPTASYNGAYRVRFVVGDLLVEGEGRARYRGRFNADFSTNLVRERDDLLDGTSRPSAFGLLNLGYRGAPNPFQGFLFPGKGFSDFNLSAVITEKSKATRSRIEASSSGVADFGLPKIRGAMPIASLGLQTSQSLRQTVFYPFAPGYRFGDLRAAAGRGYLTAEGAIPGFYVETALQIGVTQFRRIDGVDDSRDLTQPLLRPRLTVGLLRYLSDRSPVSVTGDLTVYYVANGLGGVQEYGDSRFPETFRLALAFGPPTGRLSFGVVGGRNFAQNFQKVRPTYSLGLSVGF